MEIKSFGFTPILGWSFSRYETFADCKRKYYYQYYAKYDTEIKRDKIEFLKGLTSIPMEIGTVSHDVIQSILERLLKSTEPIDSEKFEVYLKKIINSRLTKKFFEIYYEKFEEINFDQLFDKTRKCLNNFLESKRFEWIKEKAIIEKANWLIEPSRYGESRLDELKLYCKVDFLIPFEGKIFILDWKTGKKDGEKYSKQLVGYSAWAAYHLGRDACDIVPIIAYLHPEYEEISFEPTEEALIKYKKLIFSQTQEMYGYCKNYEDNIPLEKDKFPLIEDTAKCKYCNFKELCSRI